MVYLILCILSSVGIFVIFKMAKVKNINLFSIIFYNYIAASLLGFFLNDIDFNISYIIKAPWLYLALIIGVMFTGMFFLIGYSTRKAGIAVTSVSSKLSLVIPTTFSIIYDPNDSFSMMKLAGISLAIIAVVLLVWKRRTEKIEIKFMFLPVILFLGLGLVDSFVKFAQHNFIDESNLSLFSTLLFFFAWLTALVAGVVTRFNFRQLLSLKSSLTGLGLGILNYGSIYFLVLALGSGSLAGSSVFGINHMGVILTSVLVALLFFREKLNSLNLVGIIISIIAIWLLVQV